MAGQLNIKLLVASVHNLGVQFTFVWFYSVYFLILAILWRWDPF